MMGLSSHLRDDRLFDCYLLVRVGEALDPPAAEHLAECPDCRARFEALRRFMDDLRDDADAELDDVFTAEALRQQQQRIARRLTLASRPARVIHFPTPPGAPLAPVRRRPALPRWAAGAAAAGLFVGVAAGLSFNGGATRVRSHVPETARLLTPPASTMAPIGVGADLPLASAPAEAAPSDRDDLFLSEIEVAAGGPRTAELAAFDALTPHIREVSLSVSR